MPIDRWTRLRDHLQMDDNQLATPRGHAGGACESTVRVRPWDDALVEAHGHDPRSWYFERYWLSVIGPTATLIMRRIADRFDVEPDGFAWNLDHAAASMGLSFQRGLASPFGRSLHRCVMFGLARQVSDGFVVRRVAPPIAARHLKRLPLDLQQQHAAVAGCTGVDHDALTTALAEHGIPPLVAHRAAIAALASG